MSTAEPKESAPPAKGAKPAQPPADETPEGMRGVDVATLDEAQLSQILEKSFLAKTDPLHKQLAQSAEIRKQVEESSALKEQELSQVTSERQRRRTDLDATLKKLADREARLQQFKSRLQADAKAKGNEAALQAADRLREIDRREMEIRRREAALQDQENSISAKVAELEDRKRAMRHEADELEKSKKDVESRFAKGEITAKERDRQLKSFNDQLVEQSEELRARQSKLDEQEASLQKELEDARALKAHQGETEKQLRQEKDTLDTKLKELLKFRDESAARERSFLDVEQEMHAEMSQLEQQRQALEAHEAVLQEDQERLETEIKEAREAAQRMRDSEEDARKKLAALEMSLRAAVDEGALLKARLIEESQRREVQEKEAVQRKGELDRYERKLHEEISLRQRAERALEEAKHGLVEAQEELRRQTTRGEEMEKLLEGGEAKMAELEASLEGARGESLKLTKKLQAEDKELEVMRRQLDEQKKRREVSEGRMKELEEAVQTLEREVEADALKWNVLQEHSDKQSKELESLNSSLNKERETLKSQETLTKRTQVALEEARGQVEREVQARGKVEQEARRLEDSVKQLKVVAESNDKGRQVAEADRAAKEQQLDRALSNLRDEERRRQETQLKLQEQMEELQHVRDALGQAERQRDRDQETVDRMDREITKLKTDMAKVSLSATSGGDVSAEIKQLATDLERAKVEWLEANKLVRAKDQALNDVQQQVEKERHQRNELELQLRFAMEEIEGQRLDLNKTRAEAKGAASMAARAAAAVHAQPAPPAPAMATPSTAAASGPVAAPSAQAPFAPFAPPAPTQPGAHSAPVAAAQSARRDLDERISVLSSSGSDLAPLRKLDESATTPQPTRRALVKGRLSLPSELLNYLNKPNGRSIIINGKRRTGKSNFALELAEALANFDDEVLLLFTHEPDKRLHDAYAWVGEKRLDDFLLFNRANTPDAIMQPPPADARAARQKLVDAVRALKPDLPPGALPPVLDRPKSYRINTERIARLLALNPGMAEIVNLYDAVERLLPNKLVIVIDRVDALSRKYGIEYKSLVETLQRDLVRGANCDLILVQERDDQHSADRSVDGVLVMRDISRTEDFLGEIAIANLTDVVLRRPRALYRFDDGRIRMIESADVGSSTEG